MKSTLLGLVETLTVSGVVGIGKMKGLVMLLVFVYRTSHRGLVVLMGHE